MTGARRTSGDGALAGLGDARAFLGDERRLAGGDVAGFLQERGHGRHLRDQAASEGLGLAQCTSSTLTTKYAVSTKKLAKHASFSQILNSMTSPSFTTYSLPSVLNFPFSFA